MKKVYIICEKNIEKNNYENKSIVIFDDENVPKVINYESAQDLLSVVKVAEENGFDILGQEGIRPAIESGLIQLVSKSNTKAMDELKANILSETIKFTKFEEDLKEEQEEVIENVAEEVKEDNKITAETTMFKPINSNLDLAIEEREYAEYLKLVLDRSNNVIDKDGLKKIEQMTKYNEKVARMEALRQDVIDANEKVMVLSRYGSEGLEKAIKDLREKQEIFDKQKLEYRADLANAIKNGLKNNLEVEDSVEKENNSLLEEPKKEEKVEKEIIPVEPKKEEKVEKEIIPVEPKEEEKVEEVVIPVEPKEEEKVEEVVIPVEPKEEEKVEEVVIPVEPKKEEKVEEVIIPVEPKEEEDHKGKHESGVFVESNDYVGKHSKDSEYKSNFVLVPDNTEKQAKGVKPEADEIHEIKVVNENGEEETIKARSTSKFKKFLKGVGAFLLTAAIAVGAYFGIEALSKKKQTTTPKINTEKTRIAPLNPIDAEKAGIYSIPTATPTIEPTATLKPTATPTAEPTATPTVEPTAEPTIEPTAEPTATATLEPTAEPTATPAPVLIPVDVTGIVNNYCEAYNVPAATRAFLAQEEVVNFLSKYTNEDQLKEVISALCYGYEANILATKDGNFRLAEDTNAYLTSFTHDFLCAKVVVNRYNARQMVNVFGGSNISYEEIMNGFKSYTHTVRTYLMNATEPLPFHYLTNNNTVATRELNNLQEKILEVNRNRNANTLTSQHTDDFISAVFDMYVLNDESLNMSQGAKTVGGAIVDAYCAMQSNVDNGEALFLHETRGKALAGINLQEMDGHFTFEYPDKTHYEFTSLFDVMNHGYGDLNETAYRCLSQQEEILASVNKMQELDLSNLNEATSNLRNALYEEGLDEYAYKVQNGNISDRLLDEILVENPLFSDLVNNVKYSRDNRTSDYVSFEETCEGVDRLLGIQNRLANDYSTLINNRRTVALAYENYKIVTGKRYTSKKGKTTAKATTTTKVTTSQTTETHTERTKVEYEDLTTEEKESVDKQVEEIKKQEEEEHKQQEETAEKAIEDLRVGVEEGKTQEELEVIAAEAGIELSPTYQEDMQEALEEQKAGEEKKEEIEQEVEQHNIEAEEQAQKEAEEEQKRQEEERRQEEELIAQSLLLEESSPVDEEPYEEPQFEEPVIEDDTTEDLPVVEDLGLEDTESYYESHDQEIDQLDENRVDVDADEQPYVPSAKVVDELKNIRAMLLDSNVEVDALQLTKRLG